MSILILTGASCAREELHQAAEKGLRCWLGDSFAIGEPYEANGKGYSISHSGSRVLVCVREGGRVGCDLERVRPVNPRVLERLFHPAERKKIRTGRDFIRVWTAREAYGKYRGTGIRREHASLDFSQAVKKDRFSAEGCRFLVFEDAGYCYSVCFRDGK